MDEEAKKSENISYDVRNNHTLVFHLNYQLVTHLFTADELLQYKIAEFSPKLYIEYMKLDDLLIITEDNSSIIIAMIREILAYERINYEYGNRVMLQNKLNCFVKYLKDLYNYVPKINDLFKLDDYLAKMDNSSKESLYDKYKTVLKIMNDIICKDIDSLISKSDDENVKNDELINLIQLNQDFIKDILYIDNPLKDRLLLLFSPSVFEDLKDPKIISLLEKDNNEEKNKLLIRTIWLIWEIIKNEIIYCREKLPIYENTIDVTNKNIVVYKLSLTMNYMKSLTHNNLNTYKNIPISPLIDSKNFKLIDFKDLRISLKETTVIKLYIKSLVLMNIILTQFYNSHRLYNEYLDNNFDIIENYSNEIMEITESNNNCNSVKHYRVNVVRHFKDNAEAQIFRNKIIKTIKELQKRIKNMKRINPFIFSKLGKDDSVDNSVINLNSFNNQPTEILENISNKLKYIIQEINKNIQIKPNSKPVVFIPSYQKPRVNAFPLQQQKSIPKIVYIPKVVNKYLNIRREKESSSENEYVSETKKELEKLINISLFNTTLYKQLKIPQYLYNKTTHKLISIQSVDNRNCYKIMDCLKIVINQMNLIGFKM